MKIGGAHESYTRETDPAGQVSLFALGAPVTRFPSPERYFNLGPAPTSLFSLSPTDPETLLRVVGMTCAEVLDPNRRGIIERRLADYILRTSGPVRPLPYGIMGRDFLTKEDTPEYKAAVLYDSLVSYCRRKVPVAKPLVYGQATPAHYNWWAGEGVPVAKPLIAPTQLPGDIAVYGYYAPAGQAAAAPPSTSPWLYALGGAIVGYLARGAMKRR